MLQYLLDILLLYMYTEYLTTMFNKNPTIIYKSYYMVNGDPSIMIVGEHM